MPIAVVFNSCYPGGSELALLELVSSLHDAGQVVYAILPKEGPMQQRLEGKCSRIDIIFHDWWASQPPALPKWRRIWYIKGFFKWALPMAQYFRQHQIGVVISNSVVSPTGALAAKLSGKRHIWYLHEFGQEDHGFLFWYGKKWSLTQVGKLSAHVLVNSQAVYDFFAQYIPTTKMTKVYQPVDVPPTAVPVLQPLAAGEPLRCIITGRVSAHKRQLDAVRAVHKLHAAGLPITLSIQGTQDPVYGAEVAKYVHENGLGAVVKFLPYADNPHAQVVNHHVALVCSQKEAFGRVTVEAMKLGVPVVATSTAGSLELIKHEERGLLYTPGDVDTLAAHLERYYEDCELRHNMAEKAWRWAWRNCNRQVHTQDLLKVLNRLPVD